jgi:hypothetical protein
MTMLRLKKLTLSPTLGSGSRESFVVPFSSLILGIQLFSDRRDLSKLRCSKFFDVSLEILAEARGAFGRQLLAGDIFVDFELSTVIVSFFEMPVTGVD